MGDGILRDDLRIDRHPCTYRKTPHQILGGCGCLCELCSLTEELATGKLTVSEPGSAGADREGD